MLLPGAILELIGNLMSLRYLETRKMLSNSLNNFHSKNPLSFQTYKYNNKYPQNIRYNTRYSNAQNKISTSNNTNNYNNQFLYKSENKKGLNKMSLASNSQNNDLVLINPIYQIGDYL